MPTHERLGKYRILRPLGAGAMGEVYLAEHERLHVLHAIKILPSEAYGKPGFETRFEAEARIMARLRHPGIVAVHDLDRDEATGAYFIAMDFVSPDGRNPQTLDDLLRESGRLTHERTGEMMRTLCDAVAYAHEQGVLHRDIKPSNILVDAGGVVRLADFGLAEIVGQEFVNESIMASRLSATIGMQESIVASEGNLGALGSGERGRSRADSLVGTFHFMPPEVQEGAEWSERGDVYSLGAVAYRSLVGKHPIGRWELPSEHFANIPAVWDAIVEKALKTRPELRYESAKKLGDAIAALGTAPSAYSATETPFEPASSSGCKQYDKPFFFREKEYRSMESLVEAFAESEESWNDALGAVGGGYVKKWLESNHDYGRIREFEKNAEKKSEEQLGALFFANSSTKKPNILYRLGLCSMNGWGTESDKAAAARWFGEAAEKGHVSALFTLGFLYSIGAGVSKDDKKAIACYEKAAEQGDVESLYELGRMCSKGLGVPQDEQKASKWYEKAAERGHLKALQMIHSRTLKESIKAKDGSELLLIPAGEFEMGDGKSGDAPEHKVFLDAYYIGKYCVTNAQYARFVQETGHRAPESRMKIWKGVFSKSFPEEMANHPVVGVSWEDATAYAKWAECELPTEAQWEKAARGPNGYIYPWGNEWEESKCRNRRNSGSETTAPVDAYTEGASGYGTYQQAGNVREWCFDRYGEDYYESPEAARNPRGPSDCASRVLRNADCNDFDALRFRGAYRGYFLPSTRCWTIGFRLARKA